MGTRPVTPSKKFPARPKLRTSVTERYHFDEDFLGFYEHAAVRETDRRAVCCPGVVTLPPRRIARKLKTNLRMTAEPGRCRFSVSTMCTCWLVNSALTLLISDVGQVTSRLDLD
jgi:hypothetical protein